MIFALICKNVNPSQLITQFITFNEIFEFKFNYLNNIFLINIKRVKLYKYRLILKTNKN